MADLAGKTFLVYDCGLSVEHAARLAASGNRVIYFTPYSRGYPSFVDYAPGLNFEKLEKTYYFFDHVDEADCIVFFDVAGNDIANYLRKQGKVVFGSGAGEKLENHRMLMRKIQKNVGLDTQNTEKIKGVPKLREYLKRNPNKFVKLDIFRGDLESFYAKNYDSVDLILDKMEVALGAFNGSYEFMVEDAVKGIEPGFDLYFNGKDYIKPMLWGYEQSKYCYIGKYEDDKLPKPLQDIADKLKPTLRKLDYRGAISIESIITKEGKNYLIDLCARYPYPLSIAFTESIKNYSEAIYKIAKGEDVKLDIKGKYIAVLPLISPEGKENWIRLDFDKKYRKFVKTYTALQFEDKFYSVKGSEIMYVLVAVGNSVNHVKQILDAIKEKVSAWGLSLDTARGLDLIDKSIKEGEKYGLGKF